VTSPASSPEEHALPEYKSTSPPQRRIIDGARLIRCAVRR
jgi:hypothetical protein